MRSQFHGVSSDLSDETSTVDGEQKLFSDLFLKRDGWAGHKGWADDSVSNSSSTDADASDASQGQRRYHDDTSTSAVDTSTTSNDTSTDTDLQVQSKSVVADDTSSTSTVGAREVSTASIADTSTATTLAATTAAATTSSGFPDATNTGITAGAVLKVYNGTYTVTQDGANISNLEIHGDLVIDANNVTMSNIKVISNTPWHAVKVLDSSKGFTLTDSDVDGGGTTVNAIYGYGTFKRNNLHGVENGINVTGPALIQDNYIHDLNGSSEAHYDGIENNGASDMQLIHNTIINDHDQTSAVMLDTYFGSLSNITVDSNYLSGGGYTVYLDGRFDGGTVDDSTIKITNNQIGGGYWGNYAFYDDDPILSGNVGLGASPSTGSGSGSGSGSDSGSSSGTVYTGTSGNDILPLTGKSSSGNETYNGLDGNDILKGGAGADVLNGGNGSDTASYAGSNAAVNVNLQAGTASGGHAAGDTFSSIENLLGSSYNDTLTGDSGNNTLDGGAGADKLIGGSGNDVYIVNNMNDTVTESAGGGTDTVQSSVSYKLSANVENLTLVSNANGLYAVGNASNNTLTGAAGNNALDGGAGADKMIGGAGNDTYAVDNAGDTVTELAGGGYDKVYSSVSYALSSYVEDLMLNGSGNINATGNSSDNVLTGNSGNNVLTGGTGADKLIGGAGNDTLEGQVGNDILTGGAGADKFVFQQSALSTLGTDHITDFASGDKIVFDVTSGTTGALGANAFRIGTAALDTDDRFVYDPTSHSLYFDSDGSGASAKVLLAVFDNGYTPNASDIVLA